MGAAEVLGLDRLSKLRRKSGAIAATIAKLEAERPALEKTLADVKAKAVAALEASPDRAVNLGTAGPLAALAENAAALEVARAAQGRINADLAAAEGEDRQRRAAESLAAREAAIRQAHSDAVAAFAKLADATSRGYSAADGIERVHALAYPGDTTRTIPRFDPRIAAREAEDRLRADFPDVIISGGYQRGVWADSIDLPYAAPVPFDEALRDPAA